MSRYQEAYRKRYIAYIDRGLYNRFMLLPKRRHFWLAVKGTNVREEKLHSYSDGISTFFRTTSNVPVGRIRGMILKHIWGKLPEREKPPRFFAFPIAGMVGNMNGFSVKIHPSDLPHDEKERRLWEVLESLLRSEKQEGDGKKRTMGKRGEPINVPQKGHISTVPSAS